MRKPNISEHDNPVFTIRQITCIKTDLLRNVKTMRIHFANSTHKDIKDNSCEYAVIKENIITMYTVYKHFSHQIYNMCLYNSTEFFEGCTNAIYEFEARKEHLYKLMTNIEENTEKIKAL